MSDGADSTVEQLARELAAFHDRSMIELAPCPSCRRHVQVTSPICPFCTARPTARSVAAAALLIGAALSGAACGKGATPPVSAGSDGSAAVGSAPMAADAAAIADASAIADAAPPPVDAAPIDAAVPIDAAKKPKPKPAEVPEPKDDGIRSQMPYGAPSVRRRVV